MFAQTVKQLSKERIGKLNELQFMNCNLRDFSYLAIWDHYVMCRFLHNRHTWKYWNFWDCQKWSMSAYLSSMCLRKGTFIKYIHSRFLSFDPLVWPFSFLSIPLTLVHLTTDLEVRIIYNQLISSHFCWKNDEKRKKKENNGQCREKNV